MMVSPAVSRLRAVFGKCLAGEIGQNLSGGALLPSRPLAHGQQDVIVEAKCGAHASDARAPGWRPSWQSRATASGRSRSRESPARGSERQRGTPPLAVPTGGSRAPSPGRWRAGRPRSALPPPRDALAACRGGRTSIRVAQAEGCCRSPRTRGRRSSSSTTSTRSTSSTRGWPRAPRRSPRSSSTNCTERP